ncbi:MAG: hypothetical protein EA411_03865 [Saprospirales bacterium]|nr:MAG: hypothetical protein EA411_03865 [Saprospirales bacterium]
MKNLLILATTLICIGLISCEKQDTLQNFNEVEAETRTSLNYERVLADTTISRLLSEEEYDWSMYHYEIANYGHSNIVPPENNPYLTIPPPSGGEGPEPLVIICHSNQDDQSLACYGIWSIDDCMDEELAGCCDNENEDCTGEGCICFQTEF